VGSGQSGDGATGDARLADLLGRMPTPEPPPLDSLVPATVRQRERRAVNVDRAREVYKRDIHTYRARVYGGGGSYEIYDWLRLCDAAGHRCLRCRSEEKLTVDHVVPLEEGGSNCIENLQPLCAACNRWKGRESFDFRPLIQFIELLEWRPL